MMRPPSAVATVLVLSTLSSCVIGSEKYPRPRDLSPTWLVDRPRVLAVVAEPPEVRPGEAATFSALIPDPTSEDDLFQVWLACPVDDAGNGFGCLTDFSDVDLENATPEELADLGLIGVAPGPFPPTYVAPLDLLDDLSEEERLEGRYVNAQVTAFPGDLTQATSATDIDFNEVEVAYKRLVVSEARTPNHNPSIATFVVDRLEVPADAVVQVDPKQEYDLGIQLPDGTRELYEFVTSSGEVEERVEEPYASWYSTGGEVQEEVTLYPYLESTWTSPETSGEEGTWYVVLRDRRGGMAWWTQRWVVR
mgnify:CR=1 FL=1